MILSRAYLDALQAEFPVSPNPIQQLSTIRYLFLCLSGSSFIHLVPSDGCSRTMDVSLPAR